MKNVLMILFLLGGFAFHNLDAQKCCSPCPPGCCISSCCISGKGASAAATSQLPVATFASFNLGAEDPSCEPRSMTKKEMKTCLASCKALGQAAPSDNVHTADAVNPVRQPELSVSSAAPACQPLCKANPACKTSAAVVGAESIRTSREKSKS